MYFLINIFAEWKNDSIEKKAFDETEILVSGCAEAAERGERTNCPLETASDDAELRTPRAAHHFLRMDPVLTIQQSNPFISISTLNHSYRSV